MNIATFHKYTQSLIPSQYLCQNDRTRSVSKESTTCWMMIIILSNCYSFFYVIWFFKRATQTICSVNYFNWFWIDICIYFVSHRDVRTEREQRLFSGAGLPPSVGSRFKVHGCRWRGVQGSKFKVTVGAGFKVHFGLSGLIFIIRIPVFHRPFARFDWILGHLCGHSASQL